MFPHPHLDPRINQCGNSRRKKPKSDRLCDEPKFSLRMGTQGTKWAQLTPFIQQLQASMQLRFRSRSLPVQVLCGVCSLEAELFHNSTMLEVFPALYFVSLGFRFEPRMGRYAIARCGEPCR